MPDRPVFFVFGCARSGTTSLARILDTAANCVCLVEPSPNLTFETREAMEGRCENPFATIEQATAARVAGVLDHRLIYGEKNNTLGPFIHELAKLYPCKLVHVVRDGREVVRSLINWHNQLFGTVYRECREPGELTQRARDAAAALPLENDLSDYSRPRPGPGDPWQREWDEFSRLEMCAWYWAYINELYLDKLESVPSDRWIRIDYSAPSAESVLGVADFLGLEGLNADAVERCLASKVNSLEERIGEPSRFPHWPEWSDADRAAFAAIAGKTMSRLGYGVE